MDPVTMQLLLGAFTLIEKGMGYLAVLNSEDYDPSKINLEELKITLDNLQDLPEIGDPTEVNLQEPTTINLADQDIPDLPEGSDC